MFKELKGLSGKDSIYMLMNKDKTVATFNLNFYDGAIEMIAGERLPYGFDNIFTWLDKRKKFSCARDVKEFFNNIGLYTDEAIIESTHCVSLSDTYWIKKYESCLTWEDVSPWTHDYSSLISTYALDGIIVKNNKNYFSPVLSTDGSFPHTWKFNSGGNTISFVKAGTKYTLGGMNSGREPYSEYYASIIGRALGFNSLVYEIRNHTRSDGRIDVVTECLAYTSEDIGAVSAGRIGLKSYEDIIKFCKEISNECYRQILDMLFLDCLLLNTDRHYGNIEFLVKNDTQDIIGLAPIFDNNFSMLPRFIEQLETLDRSEYVARDNRTFESLYSLVKTHRNYTAELIKAKSIVLEKPRRVTLSDERLKFLNWFLQDQINWLMSI